MSLKDFWAKSQKWWTRQNDDRGLQESIDDQDLIADNNSDIGQTDSSGTQVVLKKTMVPEKKESVERLGAAFNQLVEQLQGINENLAKQVGQHEELMSRINRLPELLNSLPSAVQNQKAVVDSLVDELKIRALKDQQFTDTIQKVPTEAAKQTEAIMDMARKISVSTDIESQMAQGFSRFNDTLTKLDSNTAGNTDTLAKMSETFAASDKFLKYIVAKHNTRFMWIFITTATICILAIAALLTSLILVMK
jgi:chromosome segregation ATPase